MHHSLAVQVQDLSDLPNGFRLGKPPVIAWADTAASDQTGIGQSAQVGHGHASQLGQRTDADELRRGVKRRFDHQFIIAPQSFGRKHGSLENLESPLCLTGGEVVKLTTPPPWVPHTTAVAVPGSAASISPTEHSLKKQ